MPSMLRAGHGLMLSVITLLTIGVVMVNSAGLSIASDRAMDLHELLLGRPTRLALLAVIAMVMAMYVPVQDIYRARGPRNPVPWIVIGCIVLLLLVHVPGIGLMVNGKRRWIDLGVISFQPSEIAKWGLILVIAWHAARHAGTIGRFGRGFLVPMTLVVVICGLIGTEDLGTAVLVFLVSVGLLIAGGVRIRHVATMAPIAAIGFTAAILTNEYRINRLKAFFNPFEDPRGIGYHVIQSMTAVHSGGLAGRGLGHSVRKNGYLPEDTTDFIYAIICEELGIVGAAIIICLYTCLLLCGLSIVRRVKHPFERLVGLGVLLTIGLQALINIAVVTGAAPTKGIALPLLSNGGTGWILTAFGIGLLVAMDRRLAQSESNVAANVDQYRQPLEQPSLAAAQA